MRRGFTKGLLVGGIIAASVAAMANSDMMKPGNRRRMMRTGRNVMRKTGDIIGSIVDILR